MALAARRDDGRRAPRCRSRTRSGAGRASLAVWALPAVAAVMVWSLAPRADGDRARAARRALWRRPLAWAVALFMGIQSMAFYATLSWLPSILEDAGRSPEAAGALLALPRSCRCRRPSSRRCSARGCATRPG